MARKPAPPPVMMAFEKTGQLIPVANIQPLRIINSKIKITTKYGQIAASIREVGVIEPPVVARDRGEPGKYLLLDGHLRIEVLKDMGATGLVCLISTDDEAFTYNRRVNRIAMIQEHRMILKAVERGVPQERIAKALNVDVQEISRKRRLLEGICPEAVEMLKDKHVPINTFAELKKMAPLRQIEAAELMVAMGKYAITYARSLVAATPKDQLSEAFRNKKVRGLTNDQMGLMERESASLEREFKLAQQSYGVDNLDLVVAKGFLTRLLGNDRVVRYLAQNHQELLAEFQKISALESAAA